MMKSTLIVVLFAVATTSASAAKICQLRDLRCPAINAIYEYPQNCVWYVQCSNGNPRIYECPKPNYFYNGRCVPQWQSPCNPHLKKQNQDCTLRSRAISQNAAKPRLLESSNSEEETIISNPIVDGCVIDCRSGQQYLAHPTDCDKYLWCNAGVPQTMSCVDGTRWNQQVVSCTAKSVTPCFTGSYFDIDGGPCGGSDDAEDTVE